VGVVGGPVVITSSSVVGAPVVGAPVVGAPVVGAPVVGPPVVGANVVGAFVVAQSATVAASGVRETPSATVGSARHERSVMSVPQATCALMLYWPVLSELKSDP